MLFFSGFSVLQDYECMNAVISIKNTVAVCACVKSAMKSWRYQSKKAGLDFICLFLTPPPGAAETVQVSFFCSVSGGKCARKEECCAMCVDLITYSSFTHVLSVFTCLHFLWTIHQPLPDLWGSAWCRTFPSFVPWFNSVICLILISPWIWCTEPLKWRTKEIKNWTVDILTVIYCCTFSLIPAESAPKNTQQTLFACFASGHHVIHHQSDQWEQSDVCLL